MRVLVAVLLFAVSHAAPVDEKSIQERRVQQPEQNKEIENIDLKPELKSEESKQRLEESEKRHGEPKKIHEEPKIKKIVESERKLDEPERTRRPVEPQRTPEEHEKKPEDPRLNPMKVKIELTDEQFEELIGAMVDVLVVMLLQGSDETVSDERRVLNLKISPPSVKLVRSRLGW